MRHVRTVLVLWMLTLGASTAAPATGLFLDPVGPIGPSEPINSVGPYADPVGLWVLAAPCPPLRR